MTEKLYRIQPKQRPDKTLPYPYFVNREAQVGKQTFWKGKPLRLIGFNPVPYSGEYPDTITFQDFVLRPKLAEGMFPIFEHSDGQWFTYTDPIEKVEVVKNVRTKPSV